MSSHNLGGSKSKVQVLAGLISIEASVLSLHMASSQLCPPLCLNLLFLLGHQSLDSNPTHMTSFYVPGLSCVVFCSQLWHANSQLYVACGIQFPDQGQPGPPAVGAQQSLSHWSSREVSIIFCVIVLSPSIVTL